ncbi:MAG: efflux RND transporter periplasmic adaptor subunit [Pseudomonadota bacterium]
MKKAKLFFLKRPYIYSIIILIMVVSVSFAAFGGNDNGHETLTVTRSTFKRQVAVSGKVVATESADLGFEQGGRLGFISAPLGTVVKKGAVIASLENGDVRAELLQRQASLEREEAKLASLTQGTRPEQLRIDQQTYEDVTQTFVTAMRTAHLEAEKVLIEEINTFFDNGSSVNPDFVITLQTYEKENRIENGRIMVGEKASELKGAISALSVPYSESAVATAGSMTIDTLNSINTFIADLSRTVDDVNLDASTLDSYRSTLNDAEQAVADALDTAQTARTSWNNAREKLSLSKAGTTVNDLNAQSASVKAARADVDSAQARLRKTLIIAPFDGTVTRMDVKVGEIIASNSAEISLMSTASFNIESYVPEVHIAHIKVADRATVTLDAYGDTVTFAATVASVDPAETVRDGVSTYKVTLAFAEPDTRIKSGMTGSITIITLEKDNTIVVPQSVIIRRDGDAFVQKMVDGSPVETWVTLGDSTSLGQIEIVDGLNEGDVILVAPTK